MINEQKSEMVAAPSIGFLSFLLLADQYQYEEWRVCRCEVLKAAKGSQEFPAPGSSLLHLPCHPKPGLAFLTSSSISSVSSRFTVNPCVICGDCYPKINYGTEEEKAGCRGVPASYGVQ